uniref:Uncharacterized protein n=1 Tax=Moniliophthora roreri TaxID=221103 RepID=A0A0W0FB56_MONRR
MNKMENYSEDNLPKV